MRKKIIFGMLLLILAVGSFLGYKLFTPAVHNKDNAYFYIKDGDDVASVKETLVYQQFIGGSGFDLAARLLKFKKARSGRYKLKDGMSMYQLIKLLRSGEQSPVKVVITKERTKEAFAGKFGKRFDVSFDSLAMIRFLSSNDSLKDYGVDSNTVMAVIMPYTFEVNWNSTPEKVFKQFYASFKKFWTPERKTKADSLHLTPLQVITLASIVEEETLKKADKYNIASTYLNRIRTGMKLQADPTVKFALKDFTIKRVTGTHLKKDSPYNTYMYAGLPPGPICTPSIETIEAVLDAPETEYLYFVASSKFDGSSVFTTNFDDHLKYARLYQQELTRRMDSARKAKENK
ncbi:MAG TPA: endolytic transglycosylase MltG [Chitinophagaceae bacterium]|nr:endolytic transglycosylase MltG [Chitinophagaceae bacterium]